jgi:hypothetical protein
MLQTVKNPGMKSNPAAHGEAVSRQHRNRRYQKQRNTHDRATRPTPNEKGQSQRIREQQQDLHQEDFLVADEAKRVDEKQGAGINRQNFCYPPYEQLFIEGLFPEALIEE